MSMVAVQIGNRDPQCYAWHPDRDFHHIERFVLAQSRALMTVVRAYGWDGKTLLFEAENGEPTPDWRPIG